MLGAIEPGGDAERAPRLTDVGRAMVPLPLHPRLARIVAGAPLTPACVIAAIVDERDVLRSRTDVLPTDLALRVAIVCGHMARGEIARSGGRLGGDGLAVAGLVLGWINVVMCVLTIAAVVLFFGGLAVVLGVLGVSGHL